MNQPASWIVFPLLRNPGPCPVCTADSLRPLHLYSNRRALISPALNIALLGCESCGIVFSHPLPSDDELDRYYSAQTGWETRIPENETGVEARLELKRARYARHIVPLEALIGVPRGEEQPKVLDFGCGLGGWLDVLKARGWKTYGLEPGPRASVIAARAHTILTEIPTTADFDLIIVNHVLEHLRDPLTVTRALAAATKSGGHIYVSVPDFGRLPAHQSMGYAANERHIFSYTSASLQSLFALSGFELVAHSNQTEWPGGPVDKLDTKSVKALGLRVDHAPALAPDPLAEAIASLRGYESAAAERLLGSHPKKEPRPRRARTPAVRVGASPKRSSLRPALKRIRRFFRVWLRAAIRARLARPRA